jgi:TetR/AcrR family transcriptional regulator, regulator of autoinduction and epiphytic fitness
MADLGKTSSADVERSMPRSARAERSRAAIADAALELIREGRLRPTIGQVAQRAGISERLVYHHFTDLEGLFQAVAERQVAALGERMPPVPTSGSLEVRLRAIVAARADMNEWITPVRRASVLREPFSPTLTANRAALNAGSRRQVGAVFAAELGARPAHDAEELLAALDLTLSWSAWDALRVRGSSVVQARLVVERTVRALLAS